MAPSVLPSMVQDKAKQPDTPFIRALIDNLKTVTARGQSYTGAYS